MRSRIFKQATRKPVCRAAVLLVAVTLTSGLAVAANAAPESDLAPTGVRAVSAKTTVPHRPSLTASTTQVEEGNRVLLSAAVNAPRRAARISLQKWNVPLYYGDPSWQTVTTARVNGRRNIRFSRTVAGPNSERYRVAVTYKRIKKPVNSTPVLVTVWRWIPLSAYQPYYETGGAYFGTTTINGRAYTGWGPATFSHVGSWGSRFTPGRHCNAFKAVLGVADISSDGSSGRIAFTADDKPIYISPVLTPGMSAYVKVPLANPYRFGIQVTDTTPGGTTSRDAVESWPVLGEPAFLCTGV